jgi:hypothetical protein
MGDSVLLTLPVADDAARERWFTELQASTTNIFVAVTNQSVAASVMFVVPTAHDATNLVVELNEYFQVSRFGNLLAPWSPQAVGAKYATARQARQTWLAIGTNTATAWSSPALDSLNRQFAAARKRGATTEAERLLKEQREVRKKEEAAIYDRLRSLGMDSELIDFHTRLQALDFTNRTQRAALERQVAVRLGQTSEEPGALEEASPRHGVVSGFARHQGLLVEARWMNFSDAPADLPALVDWLCRKQCRTLKYDIHSTGFRGDDFSE